MVISFGSCKFDDACYYCPDEVTVKQTAHPFCKQASVYIKARNRPQTTLHFY